MEVLCEIWCCFERVVGFQPLFQDDAKDRFDRHLRGSYAQEEKKGVVHTLSCREEVRVTAGLPQFRGATFSSLMFRMSWDSIGLNVSSEYQHVRFSASLPVDESTTGSL